MNVVKLYGGLGNQMFQYAFGKEQERLGIEVRFDIHWNSTPERFRRPYQLDKFMTNVKLENYGGRKVIHERNLGYYPELLCKNNSFFIGYWQNHQYSDKIISTLQKDFCVREQFYTDEFIELREEIVNCNSVSCHIRRGDYITTNMHLTPLKYYLSAINFIRTIKKDPVIYVFSDDISWCKEHFTDVKYIHLEDYLDFELMKLCRSNIITNSTFSWWAARLSDNPDKIVVAPNKWSPNKYKKDASEFILLKDWIILC